MKNRYIQKNIVNCPYHLSEKLTEESNAGDTFCTEYELVVGGDRVIDVGTEWRKFSNDTSGIDQSRVGGPEYPIFRGNDLSIMIEPTSPASLKESGYARYTNRQQMSSYNRI